MQGEREKNRQALMERYGMSWRLATRLVALMGQRIACSRALLELAQPGTAVERLLLDKELVSSPDELDQGRLRARAHELGVEDAETLRLIAEDPDGWRAIALDDDILAEQTETEQPESSTHAALVQTAPTGISRRETEGLFTPEQIAELKLRALTSQDPMQKIEALRRLVFAPMPGGQKAGIFVNVLIDNEAEDRVRREAIRSLEQIGFRADMGHAVRGLFEGDETQRLYWIQRLRALMSEAEEPERAVALAVILALLEEADNTAITIELLRLVVHAVSTLVQDTARTEQFFQTALQQLERAYETLRPHIEHAILACGQISSDQTSELLWQELRRSENPEITSFLVQLVQRFATDQERLLEAAGRGIAELLNPRLREKEKARLRYALLRLGEPAAKVVLERIRKVSGVERCELVRLLDVLCTEGKVTDETVNSAAGALLDLLKVAEPLTRRTALEAVVCGDSRVRASLQSELAGEMLSHVEEFLLPDTRDRITTTLEKMGARAARPLFEFARRHHPQQIADDALKCIARIVQSRPDRISAELAEELCQYCTGLMDITELEMGGFTVVLGSLCGHKRLERWSFDEMLHRMQQLLWKARYSFDMLDALGIMGGSPNAGAGHQEELLELFRAILAANAPQEIGVKKHTTEGDVYHFGREVDFDTIVIPTAVRGLERICVSPQASEETVKEIVKLFLIHWEGVSKARVVWSPAAVDTLVHAISAAACSGRLSGQMRSRLCTSLLQTLNKISVVRSVGTICSQPDAAEEMQPAWIESIRTLHTAWKRCDRKDDERRAALLVSMGRIAANPALDAENEQIKDLRQRVLLALFRGLREGIQEAKEPLELLADCKGLSTRQRADIRGRLTKAFGLARITKP